LILLVENKKREEKKKNVHIVESAFLLHLTCKRFINDIQLRGIYMSKSAIGKGMLVLMLLLVSVFSAACGNNAKSGNTSNNDGKAVNQQEETPANTSKEKVTLKMAMWDSNNDFIDFLTDKVSEFNQENPNVTVELESFKGDGDYLQAMKVRASADSLPDIYELKPNWLNDFKENLTPINDLAVTKQNQYAATYAIDGNIYALPSVSFPELVYYNKSIFEELSLEVPTTWPQFIEVLQVIKANDKYIPYAMGGKDAWPNYPFNEFLPHSISGDENYLSSTATEDEPFGEGTVFYQGYSQIADLYNADVMGPDPLGTSWDQATDLFVSKQAAVIASGLWFMPTYSSKVGNTDDLGAFPMPYRMTESETLKLMTFTDQFYGINSNTKHPEEAKAFMEWFYSPEVYQTYIDTAQLNSAFEGVEANVPWLQQFYESNPIEPFVYIPGDAEYTRISNAIQLDVKALGQDMMAGKKVSDIASELNGKWKKAKNG